MEQQNGKAEGEREGEARGAKEGAEENQEMAVAGMSRKEKRRAIKNMKRKQLRKEMAEKEREEAEARLNDPAEQERLRAMEVEEARRRGKELKEFEERERAWMEAMELKRKKEEEEEAEAERQEEERQRKDLEESEKLEVSEKNDSCEDDEWEYVEEGPPEIIFQGNEIILRKKKVKVPKKPLNEIADRPTSNPLPPQTEDFAYDQNASSAQHVLENVAQQVPNFGTEQDKAHCPFHLKTGACRFGQRCSRVHFYPDKSCTLLMKNMYNGPGIAWDQDEGLEVRKHCCLVILKLMASLQWRCLVMTLAQLELKRLTFLMQCQCDINYTDEEVERYYEEFYEDVHTEFLKYGEIVNFKVCRNGSFHLRGNVYVHYKSLESAVLAYQAINGRYFAGKQVKCEFVNVTRWKVAICGEYMKSRLKTCSRGTACNFIHCFRNPGGDYEWADWDKPPPRYWVKKMVALFGYSDEYLDQLEHEHPKTLKDSSKVVSTDSNRQRSRRSRSTDTDHVNDGPRRSYRSCNYHVDTWESSRHDRLSRSKEYGDGENLRVSGDTEDSNSDREVGEDQWYVKRKLRRESGWSEYSPGYRVPKKRTRQSDYDDDSSDEDEDHKRRSGYKRKSSRHYSRQISEDRARRLDKEKEKRSHHSHSDRSSRECSREGSLADHGDGDEDHGVYATQESYKRDRYKHGHHQQYRSSSEQLHKITETREFDGRKKITHDIAFPGESSEGKSAKSGHHEHKRRGSEPQIDVSVEANHQVNNEKRSLDANPTGYSSDRDWNKSRHHRHKRSPGHHDKVLGLPHNHRNSKERKPSHKSNKRRDHETGSDTNRLDRSRKGKRYDPQRRSSGNGESVSESPEHHGNYDEGRSDNETQRERHHHHKRRHSTLHRRGSQAPENDPYANPNYNKSESGAYRSWDEVVCEPEENIDWMDRWRP